MAMAHCNQSPNFPLFPNPNPVYRKKFSSFSIRCSPNSSSSAEDDAPKKKRLSQQSSWEAKDSEGRDYLYRLGKEADNMNIAVGARSGVIDDLFTGNFLGRDSDIVFDYRQKVTRSFEYLQGDYYIAPLFMDKVGKFCKIGKVVTVREFTLELSEDLSFPLLFLDAVCHITKNYLAHILNTKVPLILGIWGGKGQGKSFQTELIFQTMGIEPVIMSAGELESERAGEPGKLIRERYRTASQVVQNQTNISLRRGAGMTIVEGGEQKLNVVLGSNQELNISCWSDKTDSILNIGEKAEASAMEGKMSCLMINDIDAGLGRFGNTQMTVNNQIVVGTLMNLADNPTRVSIGQDWRETDATHRIPIIVTGNDFSTIYAPLIRDGRMEKFYWQPNREDIVNIVRRMYEKDGISRDEVISIVNTFPNQALDFYGALRSRTYDRSISKWVEDIGGVENLGSKLLKRRKSDKLPVYTPPKQTVEALLESGYSLIREQQLIMETKLSKEYMKNIDD